MERMKNMASNHAQSIRREHREQIMAQKREWGQIPSAIVEIPYRINYQQWKDYQLFLDLITEKDLQLIEQTLKTFVFAKWNEKSQLDNKENKINILRLIFRLQIYTEDHVKSLINILKESYKEFIGNRQLSGLMFSLQIIKEIAISFEQLANHKETSFQNQGFSQSYIISELNQAFMEIQLYSSIIQNNKILEQQVKNYRMYYLAVLADTKINIELYLRNQHFQQICSAIYDSWTSINTYEIQLSIEIIKKIIHVDRSSNNNAYSESIEVLLIKGLSAFNRFIRNQGEMVKENQSLFFLSLLTVVSKLDIFGFIKVLDVLAQLIQVSDSYIKAMFSVQRSIQRQFQDPSTIILRSHQYQTYQQLILTSLQHIMQEVRLKVYWLISNITGSELYYRQCGLVFIKYVFHKDLLNEERMNYAITNEIQICIINYLCNIRSKEEIDQIYQLLSDKSTENNRKETNCLLYCLQATFLIIQNLISLLDSSKKKVFDMNYQNLLHRTLFAIMKIIQIVGKEHFIKNYLTQYKVGLHISKLHELYHNENKQENLLGLMENLMNYFDQKVQNNCLL